MILTFIGFHATGISQGVSSQQVMTKICGRLSGCVCKLCFFCLSGQFLPLKEEVPTLRMPGANLAFLQQPNYHTSIGFPRAVRSLLIFWTAWFLASYGYGFLVMPSKCELSCVEHSESSGSVSVAFPESTGENDLLQNKTHVACTSSFLDWQEACFQG